MIFGWMIFDHASMGARTDSWGKRKPAACSVCEPDGWGTLTLYSPESINIPVCRVDGAITARMPAPKVPFPLRGGIELD